MPVNQELSVKIETQINKHDFSVSVEVLEKKCKTFFSASTEFFVTVRSNIDGHTSLMTLDLDCFKDVEVFIADTFMWRAMQHDEECDCGGTFQLHHRNQSEDNKRIINEMGRIAA